MGVIRWLYEAAKTVLFWLLVFGLFLTKFVHADTLTQSQLVDSSTSTTNVAIQSLGTGLSPSYISAIEGVLYINSLTSLGSPSTLSVEVDCYDNSSRSAATGDCINLNGSNYFSPASVTFTPPSAGSYYYFTATSVNDRSLSATSSVPMIVDPSKYYFIKVLVNEGSGASFTYRDAGIAASVVNPCIVSCGGLGAIYYGIYQDITATSSSVGPFTYPTNSLTTSTSFPTVVFSYYNTGVYIASGVVLVDTNANESIFMPEQSITSDGAGTYSQVAHLTAGHYYTATPYIRDAAGNYLYGTQILFTAVQGGLGLTNFDIATTSFGALSNCDFTSTYFSLSGCMGYWFIPDATSTNSLSPTVVSVVEGLPPFNTGFEFINIFANASSTASTSTLPSLDIALPTFLPDNGTHVDLTPWDELLGPGSMLSTATNPDTGHTLKEIVFPLWSGFVWLLFTIAVASEIFGWGGKNISNM